MLMPHFAAEVSGVDLRRPLPDSDIAEIRTAIAEHGVLVFPAQDIAEGQQVAFARQFGDLEVSTSREYNTVPLGSEVIVISNIDENGGIMQPADRRVAMQDANELWHTDSSFKPFPAKLTTLWAKEIPAAGGDTEFADMRIVWDELPQTRKEQLEPLIAEHSLIYSRQLYNKGWVPTDDDRVRMAPVSHPIVRRHPDTGRKAVYVASHIGTIGGYSKSQTDDLVAEMMDLGTRPGRVYVHKWRRHDLVMWDNRSVLHRARPYDRWRERRSMHRVVVAGDREIPAR